MSSKRKYISAAVVLVTAAVLIVFVILKPEPVSSNGPRTFRTENPVSEVLVNSVSAVAKGNFQKLYQVKKGESLSAIARKHNVSARDLINANQDKDAFLAVDEWLVIPKSRLLRTNTAPVISNARTNEQPNF